MSAVEEYRKSSECIYAELEADREAAIERLSEAKDAVIAELEAMLVNQEALALAYVDLKRRAVQAEAELAAKEARRCPGCRYYRDETPPACACNIIMGPTQIDCCNHWAERSTP